MALKQPFRALLGKKPALFAGDIPRAEVRHHVHREPRGAPGDPRPTAAQTPAAPQCEARERRSGEWSRAQRAEELPPTERAAPAAETARRHAAQAARTSARTPLRASDRVDRRACGRRAGGDRPVRRGPGGPGRLGPAAAALALATRCFLTYTPRRPAERSSARG